MTTGIDGILKKAAKRSASDIIITAGSPPLILKEGKMVHVSKDPMTEEQARDMVYELLSTDQVAQFERERELDFGITYQDTYRFRGNAFWQRGAVGAALRLVPTKVPAMETLHLPNVMREFADAPQGLLLVTGPTGHGKSTTQAAMIDYINRNRQCHIVTIEDPIEFVHSNVKSVIEQREVGFDTLTFTAALRHVLRQAPNVILIGEMRDLETIAIALTAAETGHLVISTLHTNDASQSIDRMVDVFPPHAQNQVRAQLSACLLGIVGQRLLPRSDGTGRVLACEILRNTPAVANLIRENKSAQLPSVIETQAKVGMISMDAAIKRLYMEGTVTEQTARRHMRHPQTLFGG